MKFHKLFLFALIATGMQACVQPAKKVADSPVKYYRAIQFSETPWDTEKGAHELTAKETKTINNYKFTYNENKQLVSVEYNRNKVLLDYSSMNASKVTYTYDDYSAAN